MKSLLVFLGIFCASVAFYSDESRAARGILKVENATVTDLKFRRGQTHAKLTTSTHTYEVLKVLTVLEDGAYKLDEHLMNGLMEAWATGAPSTFYLHHYGQSRYELVGYQDPSDPNILMNLSGRGTCQE